MNGNQGVNSDKAVQKLDQSLEQQKKKPAESIEDMINRSAKALGMALPEHMRPERMVRIALTTLRINPKLYKCEPRSFLAALFQSAQLGLEPNTPNGESWIIPYNTRINGVPVLQAQFQVGAYGFLKLFWNHQNSVSIQLESVHQNDFFEYDLGECTVKHRLPSFDGERGDVVGYYAYAKLTNGGRVLKVMSKKEVLEHAKRFSKCYIKKDNKFMDDTPWASHFDSMAKKTVLIQLMKVLPKSAELQRAINMDETIKNEVSNDMTTIPPSTSYAEIIPPDEKEQQQTTITEGSETHTAIELTENEKKQLSIAK